MSERMSRRSALKRMLLMGGAATATAVGADGILGVGKASAGSGKEYMGPDNSIGDRGIIGGYFSYTQHVLDMDENELYTQFDSAPQSEERKYCMWVKFENFREYRIIKGNKVVNIESLGKLEEEFNKCPDNNLLEIVAQKTNDNDVDDNIGCDEYLALGDIKFVDWEEPQNNSYLLPMGILGTVLTALGIGAGIVYKRKVSGRKVVPNRIPTAIPVAQPVTQPIAQTPLPSYLPKEKPISKAIHTERTLTTPAITVAPKEKEARRKFLMSTWDRIHKVESRERQSQFLTAYDKLAEQHNRGNYDTRFGEEMDKLSRLVNAEFKIEEDFTQVEKIREQIKEEEL